MNELPVSVRRSIEIVGLLALGAIIISWNQIITPLLTAFFVCIVLLPVFRFLRRKKIPESIAIVLSILFVAIIIAGVIWFFSAQVGKFITDFSQIKENVTQHLNKLSNWINEKTDFSTKEQVKMVNDQSRKLLDYAGGLLTGAAVSVGSVLIFFGLLPIYIFLILYYRNLLLRFVFLWFPPKNHDKVKETISEIESIIKNYIIGLAIQITYMTILLGGTLWLLGIEHALLIGVIFAILNLIPYVGALFGNIIGVLLTLSSSQELWPVLEVLLTIAVVQFLDNNILMPSIVGSKVKINALATIVGVIVGGALAGVAGMFLSLPTIAVMKIVFDRSEKFKQWGVLFGDERPDKSPMQSKFFRFAKKREQKPTKKMEAATKEE